MSAVTKAKVYELCTPECSHLLARSSVWVIGGDGFAYDIGFGGLDHVISQGAPVKILILDTEVYSNTGGHQSKATPIAAQGKFNWTGKELPKKDLGRQAMVLNLII